MSLDLGSDNSSHLKQLIYGDPSSGSFDGINLRGNGASRHFTYRAKNALVPVLGQQTSQFTQRSSTQRKYRANYHDNCPQTQYQNRAYYHTSCPQTQYQRRMQDGFLFPKKFKKFSNNSDNITEYGTNIYTVPIHNRYPENF